MAKKTRRWWTAWILALVELAVLGSASLLLFIYAPWRANVRVETGAFWLDALVIMGAPVLGLLIALRQPGNRYGWLWLVYGFCSAMIAISAAIYYMHAAKPDGYPLPTALLLWSYIPANVITLLCTPLFALWFPNGKPPNPRWRFLEWWLAIDLLLFLPGAFTAGVLSNSGVAIDNPLGFIPQEIVAVPVAIAWFGSVLASLLAAVSIFIRYRRGRSEERQQIKWFLPGGAALAATFLLPFFPVSDGMPSKIFNVAMLLVVYVTIGIAILRYRLFDIDVIIRRTLVWTLVSGTLALVYFGAITLLQSFYSSISDQRSPVAIVISTLVIAALFSPLRRRVQDFVDRRFYRRKYDAEKALESFASFSRNVVELETLTDNLLSVVQETLQPVQISLWMKPHTPRRPE